MFPLLSLVQIDPDPKLVRRLPRHLAYYHQALLIAQDETFVTVAMAHPERAAVVTVLETLLGMPVKPVRSEPDEIRSVLDQVWQESDDTRADAVLTWGDAPPLHAQALAYARRIAPVFGFRCDPTAIATPTLEDLLKAGQQANPALIVASVDDPTTRRDLVHRASTPVLLVQGDVPAPGAMLHILRGHTPDRYVIDWLIPLAHHFHAPVTLLAAATPSVRDYYQRGPLSSDVADLLMRDHPARLVDFGHALASVNLDGQLKIRQGQLEAVIADELSACRYALIAIAAEAYGNFVHRVLQNLPDSPVALLVVKPYYGWSSESAA